MSDINVWRYVVPSVKYEGWGIFLLDSTGYFSCISDWGNFSHLWTSFGTEDFRAFLCQLEKDYLVSKVAPKKQYDGEKTLRLIKEHILQSRRSGSLSKEAALREWAGLSYFDFHTEHGFGEWVQDTDLDSAWELTGYSYDPQALMFCEKLWPRFVELLQKDLTP